MSKESPSRPNFFQVLSIPVLFVQYLFSFAVAAGLKKTLGDTSSKKINPITPSTPPSEEVNTKILKIVDEEEPSQSYPSLRIPA
ncbi:MAG: hypothetical protein AAFY71_14860 [Bacteroidota bacterium]